MQVEETAIPAVKIVTPKKHGDARGFFSEVYSRSAWDKAGLDFTFVQDNHSFSAATGILRGLHFQTPPSRRTSSCAARAAASSTSRSTFAARRRPSAGMSRSSSRLRTGASCWSRSDSPTPSSPWSPTVEVLYKTTAPYSAANDRGVAWDDPDHRNRLAALAGGPVLSDKDRRWPRLKDAPDLFE